MGGTGRELPQNAEQIREFLKSEAISEAVDAWLDTCPVTLTPDARESITLVFVPVWITSPANARRSLPSHAQPSPASDVALDSSGDRLDRLPGAAGHPCDASREPRP